MMLQHPGQVSASEVSASAIVPCLSPPGSLVFEDFANLTPFVKEELRFAIQNKHLCHRMSSALESVTVSGRPLEMAVTKTEVGSPRSLRFFPRFSTVHPPGRACSRQGAAQSVVTVFITARTPAASLGSQDRPAVLTAPVTASAPRAPLSPTLVCFPVGRSSIRHRSNRRGAKSELAAGRACW